MLISRHGDGEFIAKVIKYFGMGAVRGSYRKASISSIREILAELKQGTTIGITPDGPKGPRLPGQAWHCGARQDIPEPIVPVAYGASRKRSFASWDRFVLPYPFSRILFLWGDPLYVAADARADAIEYDAKRA